MADGNHDHLHRFGSLFEGTDAYRYRTQQKVEAFGLLDRVCQALEPTETQKDRAKTSYEAVGQWLSGDLQLVQALIYVQGSAAHGTMVKPIDHNEHDVDLICRILGYGPQFPAAALKRIVGDRLRAHGVYRDILEEMPRCWRLNYAGDFHLDITPSILNPACSQGGELVPDKRLQTWKASNPAGFRDLFARRAALQPMQRLAKSHLAVARAEVVPFPVSNKTKGVLRRAIQLLKRHRDIEFRYRDEALAPLSIIITTLASRAYEHCVERYAYDNELDLVCDTIRAMPWFIEKIVESGTVKWVVPNETTTGENFAEKWNSDRSRRTAFDAWHAQALADFEAVKDAIGIDSIQKQLSGALGEEPVRKAVSEMTEAVGGARSSSSLVVRPSVGLSTGVALSGTPVRANTFFGRR